MSSLTPSLTPSQRRVAVASFAGTTIEFFDFFIYGTAAALVFRHVFFPALGAAAGTVAAIATFAVAFLARPLGSVLFGRLGDRVGRKQTLIATLLLMGLSTAAVGLLPGAASIGVAAPIVLVALRFLQGLAVGGEWGGAALLPFGGSRPGDRAEPSGSSVGPGLNPPPDYAPPDRRGRWGMYPQLGPGIAFALASGTFLVTGAMMSPEAFLAWGWRVPFLVSVVLVGVGLYVRLRIAETPVFRELLERQERSPAPVREAFGTGRREILLVGGTLAAVFGGGYIGTVYVTSYATAVLKVPLSTMFGIGVVAGLVLAGVVAVAAIGSDRFGRRRMILAGNLVMIVVGMVAFPLMDTGVVALVGLGLCLILAASGIGLGPAAAYLPELFATRHRCTGAGSAYALAAVVGGALPPVLAPIVQASLGSTAVGAMLSALGLLGVVCGLALPETRHRSLRGATIRPALAEG